MHKDTIKLAFQLGYKQGCEELEKQAGLPISLLRKLVGARRAFRATGAATQGLGAALAGAARASGGVLGEAGRLVGAGSAKAGRRFWELLLGGDKGIVTGYRNAAPKLKLTDRLSAMLNGRLGNGRISSNLRRGNTGRYVGAKALASELRKVDLARAGAATAGLAGLAGLAGGGEDEE